jgi:hypothetical protein
MHPPALLARASLAGDGSVLATVIIPPYRTTERYLPAGQTFWDQILSEMALFTASPVPLNVFALIDEQPFREKVAATFRVSIPTRGDNVNAKLSYHFVKRPGVTVSVTPVSPYQADVSVGFDPSGYTPPGPPGCTPRQWSLSDVEKLMKKEKPNLDVNLQATFAEVASAAVTAPLWLNLIPVVGQIAAAIVGSVEPWIVNAVASGSLGFASASCSVADPAPTDPRKNGDDSVVEDPSQSFPLYGWVSWRWIQKLQRSPFRHPNQVRRPRPL